MLEFLTILLMLGSAAWFAMQGLFFAAVMWLTIWMAGFFAFWLFEPVAVGLEKLLGPFADAVALVGLFSLGAFALRCARRLLVRHDPAFPLWLERSGGAVFGLVIGYALTGFIVCVWQTLPIQENFLGYDPQRGVGLGSPDRMWLAAMQRASQEVLARGDSESSVFDPDASFVWRYARHRRIPPGGDAPRPPREEFPFGPVSQR